MTDRSVFMTVQSFAGTNVLTQKGHLLDFTLQSGTRHGKVSPRGESKSAAPHSQWRNQRCEPGGGEFSEGGPLAIVWACNN